MRHSKLTVLFLISFVCGILGTAHGQASLDTIHRCDRGPSRPRLEPRSNWSRRRGRRADRFKLKVSYVEGRRHLPVIDLRYAA